jgi:hypothetical protein
MRHGERHLRHLLLMSTPGHAAAVWDAFFRSADNAPVRYLRRPQVMAIWRR